MPSDAPPPPPLPVEWTISWATLLKLMAAIVLALALVRLQPLVIPLLMALLIAMTLAPLLEWTGKRGWPRWVGIAICALFLFGLVGGFVSLIVPTLTNQGSALIQKLPAFKENLLQRVPGGSMKQSVDRMLNSSSFNDPQPLLKEFVAWAGMALEGIASLFIVLIIGIYFLVDGPGTYEWLIAFFPEKHRQKMAEAAPEFVSVVGHYVGGQLILSTLCGIYTFALLSILHVPSAILLAVLAGIFDVLPLIGIVASTVMAVGMALATVPGAAPWIAAAYFLYHMIENYFILPKVYGNRLRLSALTVLLSCLASVLLLGYVGAVLVFPLVACYPIVERIWLKPYLERDTVRKHQELDRSSTEG